MARRQNVRDRIGMAVYEKKKLNKKLVTMQKSFQEVKHLIGDEKKKNYTGGVYSGEFPV